MNTSIAAGAQARSGALIVNRRTGTPNAREHDSACRDNAIIKRRQALKQGRRLHSSAWHRSPALKILTSLFILME
jgi:hypothetical protein